MLFPIQVSGMLPLFLAQWDNAAQWGYFKLVFNFIDDEIATFQGNLLYDMGRWLGSLSMILVTIWIMWQGFQSVQGRGRYLVEIVHDGARAALIVGLATTMTLGGTNIYKFLAQDLPNSITQVMTGKSSSAGSIINDQMTAMEAALAGVDALNVYTGDNPNLKSDQDRARWMAGIGVAGPMVVGGALLVMYKIGLALFVGFAPLFMMCLIFRSTHALFQKWLLYGIGTMFAQALMAAMAVLCFKIVLATAVAFGAQYAVAAGMDQPQQSVSSLVMLQGGIGLLLTLLLVTVPPMAAYFFQGTLGSYMTTSVFGGATLGGGTATSRSGTQGQSTGHGGGQKPKEILQQADRRSENKGSFNNQLSNSSHRLPQNTDSADRDVIMPYDKGPRL